MDFEDSPELAEFRTEVRAFLSEHAALRKGDDSDWSRNSAATDPDTAEEFRRRCHQWQRTLFDNGWAELTWPEGFGGRGFEPKFELENFEVVGGPSSDQRFQFINGAASRGLMRW